MKKISILLLVSLCSFVSFGQFTNKQVVANGKTLFVSAGAIKGDSGVVIPSFNDTSLANSVQIKNTAGILIKSKDTLYLRADCLCKWVAVGTSTTIKPDSFKMMYPIQVYDSAGLTRVRIAYSWQDSALAVGGGGATIGNVENSVLFTKNSQIKQSYNLVYDSSSNNLSVGNTLGSGTESSVSLNNSRVILKGMFNGAILNVGSGFAGGGIYDNSKTISFQNRGNDYLKLSSEDNSNHTANFYGLKIKNVPPITTNIDSVAVWESGVLKKAKLTIITTDTTSLSNRINTKWGLKGNGGTDSLVNFLGTIDNQPLIFKVNGDEIGRLGIFNGNVAFGLNNKASGNLSTSIGSENIASGYASTAIGYQTTASSDYSTAIGKNTIAIGEASTAMGKQTTASGIYSTSMGGENTASGVASTSMGFINQSIGNYSTSMGQGTTSYGETSTAIGYQTTAIGEASTAIGKNTIAIGDASTSMGLSTESKSLGSATFGIENDVTDSPDPAIALPTDRLIQVGKGGGTNALTILRNGNTAIGTTLSPDSNLVVDKGIQFKGIYPSTNSTDSMLVKNSDGGVGLRAIPSGGTTKYTTNGYGTIVDSTSNLYTIKADTAVTAKLRDAAINAKLNIADAATTYYPLTGGSYLSAINGTGFLGLTAQTTQPTAPTTGLVKLYANATGRLSWLTSIGFARTINSRPLTADRTYTFYDRDYTVADSADVAGKQATLVSGTNIKTVNGNTLLGSGDVSVGTVTSVAALTLGTTGTDLSSTVATGTTTPVITLNVPDASVTARGVITTGTQTIAGAKTFNNSMTVNGNVTSSASGGVATFPLFQSTAPLLTSYTSAYAASGNISTAITGNKRIFYDATSWSPTSGTATFSSHEDNRTINQTGTATGITRGFWANPTLTSAVDYRGIEITNGSVVLPYRAVTTTTTIAQNNHTVDCTSGTFTLTLPTAVGTGGKIFVVKNSGTGAITLATTSSQTIDGSTTKTLSSQYSGYQLQSDNANWKIIAIF